MKIINLEEAFQVCGVKREMIIHFIEEDWVHPIDANNMDFDEEDIARIQLIQELKTDFGVNDEGVSIILQLLDQLNRMHLELSKLQHKNH